MNVLDRPAKRGKRLGALVGATALMTTGLSGFGALIATQAEAAPTTQTFSFNNGTAQTFTVPANLAGGTISVTVDGGGGGAGGNAATGGGVGGPGGAGGHVTGSLAATAGNTLSIVVGGGGKAGKTSTCKAGVGGKATGGAGGTPTDCTYVGPGGGGGGASSITDITSSTVVAVAGGGGGGGGGAYDGATPAPLNGGAGGDGGKAASPFCTNGAAGDSQTGGTATPKGGKCGQTGSGVGQSAVPTAGDFVGGNGGGGGGFEGGNAGSITGLDAVSYGGSGGGGGNLYNAGLTGGSLGTSTPAGGNGSVTLTYTLLKKQTISFTSSSPSPATVGSTYTPSATATSGLNVTLTIDPSSSSICTITAGVVTFNALGSCVIDANQPGDSTTWAAAKQVTQSVTVTPAPNTSALLTPSSHDFGNTAPGQLGGTQVFTLLNTSSPNASVNVTSAMLGGGNPGQFQITNDQCTNATLAGTGDSCTVTVQFAPTAVANVDNATLSVASSASNSPSTSVLTGESVVGPASSATPSSLTFVAEPGTTSPTQTVTVTNAGGANLTITNTPKLTGTRFVNDDTGLVGACAKNLVLGPGGTCFENVAYSPGAAEAIGKTDTGTLTIRDNGSETPKTTVALSGTVEAATSKIVSTTPVTETTPAGTTSSTTFVNVLNNSTDPLTLHFSGVGTLSGSGKSRFSIDNSTPPGTVCANNVSLAPGAICYTGIDYSPKASESVGDTDNATLTIQDDGSNVETVALIGTVAPTATALSQLDQTGLTFGAPSGTTSGILYVNVKNVSPAGGPSLVFPSNPVASSSDPHFTVNTSGSGAPNPVCSTSTSLAHNQQCSIGVQFSPGSVSPGSNFTGTLTVNDNGSNAETVNLSGSVPVVTITSSVTGGPVACGPTNVGVEVTCTNSVTVHNSAGSGANLTFSSGVISSTNPDFTLDPTSGCTPVSSIAAGGTCTLVLDFTPVLGQASTTQNATITVLDNDTTAQPTFAASGQVNPPAVHTNVTGGPATCGPTPESTAIVCSNTQTVNNLGTSTANLTFAGPNLISSSNSDFTLSGGTCSLASNIAPGGACTLVLTFDPSTAGPSETSTVTVLDNDTTAQPTFTANGTVSPASPPPGGGGTVGLSTTGVGFGTVSVGNSSTRTLTIINTNSSTGLNLTGLAISGPFTITGGTCTTPSTIAPGDSCTVQLRYTATLIGMQTGTLTISTPGASNGTTHNVGLTGSGM